MDTDSLRRRGALTDRIIEKAKPAPPAPGAKGVYYLRDGGTPGFGVRVTETGSKAFIFEARFKGRTRRVILGPYPALSTAAARRKAHKKRADLVEGIDPGARRRAARSEITLRDLVDRWMDGDLRPKGPARTHKRTWREDEQRVRDYFAPWLARRLSDISLDEVAELHARIARERGPYAANRTLALLKAMLGAAQRRGLLAGTTLPTDGVEPYAEKKRERLLSTDALRRLLRAIVDEPTPTWRAFFLLALLVGQRRNEILSARWSDIDFESGRWVIPRTKAGRQHVLPLTPDVVAILEQVPRRSEYVFASDSSQEGHLVEPKKAWARVLKRAKLENFRIHDLRHAHASLQAEDGVSLTLVARILGHSQVTTTARYTHVALAPMRRALEDHSRRVLELLEQKSEAIDVATAEVELDG